MSEYKYKISGKFHYEGEEFKDAKFDLLEEFLYEVMGINVLDKEEMKRNMELLNCELNEWFESKEEIKLFNENDNIILLTGFDDHYIIANEGIEKALMNYIKESEEFKKTFRELSINGERII